ncbi:hypothetical protein ACHAWX_003379 [Stephanocyclus meneghinianus]
MSPPRLPPTEAELPGLLYFNNCGVHSSHRSSTSGSEFADSAATAAKIVQRRNSYHIGSSAGDDLSDKSHRRPHRGSFSCVAAAFIDFNSSQLNIEGKAPSSGHIPVHKTCAKPGQQHRSTDIHSRKMPSKPEEDDGGKGARRTRAKTPLYRGKRKHDNKADDDGDNASDSGAGLKPSNKHSSREKRGADVHVSPRDSKQRHGSRPRAAAAMRKSLMKFEDKVRVSRSRTPKPRPNRKEGDDAKVGERSATRSLSRARKHEDARSPSTSRKKVDDSLKNSSPNELNKKKSEKLSSEAPDSGEHVKDKEKEDSKLADKLRAKKKEGFHLHRRRSTDHPSGPPKEDPKQSDKARSQRKVDDHKVNLRSSICAPRTSEPSAFKLKRQESRDDLCLLISKQSDLRRNNSFNESTFSNLIDELRKDKSDSKEKHLDSKERPNRRKPAIERRHSDETGKSLIIDRKEVMARRNSMTENKDDLLRQSKRITIPRSASTGSLKKSIESADGNAITSGKRSDSKAGTTVTSKDSIPSSKETPARSNRRNIQDTKPPPKATTKDVIPTRTISKESAKEEQKKDERKTSKPPIETAAPVSTPAAVTIIQESKGIRISRLTMCAVCLLYIFSLAVVGVLGFWFHMIFFSNKEQTALNWSFGNDVKAKPADGGDEAPLDVHINSKNLSLSPASLVPSSSFTPSSSSSTPTVIPNQLVAESKKPPPSSTIPTISLDPTSSPRPTISHYPSAEPSYMPSTSFPTSSPSTSAPTLSRIPSLEPSMAPSTSLSPSSTPTGIPKCPDVLLKLADLGKESIITMRYEIIPLPLSDPYGGLFCVSIEHKGNAGWIGFAVSEASRDPAFGRKEAIIGIPGVMSMVAVAPPGADVAVGQQVGTSVLDGPKLFNPGKYEIPAGGVDGYAGPSIETLLPPNRQTLGNATVAIIGPDDNPLQKPTTTMTFTKFLREPNEIEIDPFKSTLFLYAVATIDEDGEYNDNPDWLANYITLLESETTTAARKRLRHHLNNIEVYIADTSKG